MDRQTRMYDNFDRVRQENRILFWIYAKPFIPYK